MGGVRDQLIKEAVALLRSSGPDAVTTTAVAEAVGIKQPSVYAHFRNREALLRAAIDVIAEELADYTRQAQAGLRAAGAGDPEALRAHFTTIIDNARVHRGVITVWLTHRTERSPLGDALRQVDETFVEAIAEHMASVRPQGARRAENDRFARVILEAVASVLRLNFGGHLPKADAARLLVGQVFAASTLLSSPPSGQ